MSNTENDLLSIKRDALLSKKRIINAIQKLKYYGPKSAVKFETNCNYLTEAAGIHEWHKFKNLLDGIQAEQVAYFDIESHPSVDGWGSNIVEITLGERFDELAKQISDEYHKVNTQLGRDAATMRFEDYDLHTRIKRVTQKLYQSNNYKEAILNGFIEVINRVKEVAGSPKSPNNHDLDGDSLMNYLFGFNGEQQPRLKLNDFNSELDRAEQRGLWFLYKGICGIRDKKAHLNFIQNNPRITIEYLSLASLLMRLLDDDFLRQYNNPQ